MTYHSGSVPLAGRGGLVQAASYNFFASLLNSVYGDLYAGTTDVTLSNYGYGKLPNIDNVSIGALIRADDWNKIFNAIKLCGTHQGTDTTPIPASVDPGDLIVAYNDYLTTQTLKDVIGNIVANRLVVAPSQLSLISGSAATTSSSWTSGIEFTWQINFGSWDSARYFFNTGGSATISGSYAATNSAANYWQTQLVSMGTVSMSAQGTNEFSTYGSNIGFYNLTTSYQTIYRRIPSGGSYYYYGYSNNYVEIQAKLNTVAGTSGAIDFKVRMLDHDAVPAPKTGTISFTPGYKKSSGVIPYSGISTITNGTYSTVSAGLPGGKLLAIYLNTTSAIANIVGEGTATTPSITVSVDGGDAPYTYSWVNYTNSVSFSNSTGSATSFSKSLSSGDIQEGTAVVTVEDSLGGRSSKFVNWSMVSNLPNIDTQ